MEYCSYMRSGLSCRLQAAHKAVQAPENVWANEQVFNHLAEKLGLSLQDDWKEQLYQRTAPVKIAEN